MAEKRCFKCGRTLPLDEFYPHPRMADGHLNKCKSCAKNDAKQRYYTKHDDMMTYDQKRLDDPRRREKQREYGRKKRLVHRAETTASQNRWRERNKHKRHAHAVVNNALRTGALARKPCEVCGDPKSQGHHDDYSKPLDVVWLCPKHHGERHRRSQFRQQPETREAA
jgi:hypothetical protein